MEKKFSFTKTQLTAAFETWNNQYMDNPENFACHGRDHAEQQSEYLLDLLQKQKKRAHG